jgi:hypothetical protein
MNTYKIYALQDPITYKIKYIGITKNKLSLRLSAHLTRAKNNPDLKWHRLNWLRSLQKINKKPNIILIEELNTTLKKAFKREEYWIRYFKKRYKLTNTSLGGDGHKGYKWSKELYKKRSKKVKQYDKKGNLIKIYPSIKEAAKTFNRPNQDGKISQICKGKKGRKTFMGYVWRYENDSFDKYDYKHNTSSHKTKEFREKTRQRQLGANNSFSKGVQKLNDKGEIIETYVTINDWMKANNKKGADWLKHCIKNNRKYLNYYWKYV